METNSQLSKALKKLDSVMDPEIPFLTVLEMGMVRTLEIRERHLYATVTPTYSGCPATEVIERDVREALRQIDPEAVVEIVHSPAWSTDWIDDATREKMRANGIAPPIGQSADKSFLLGKNREIPCPLCRSMRTRMVSAFGSTACKAHFQCLVCLEPFDHFKCI